MTELQQLEIEVRALDIMNNALNDGNVEIINKMKPVEKSFIKLVIIRELGSKRALLMGKKLVESFK